MDELNKELKDVTHAILAVQYEDGGKEVKVLHICAYFEEPSAADYDALRKELEEDDEFGLIGIDFELIAAPDYILADIKTREL